MINMNQMNSEQDFDIYIGKSQIRFDYYKI